MNTQMENILRDFLALALSWPEEVELVPIQGPDGAFDIDCKPGDGIRLIGKEGRKIRAIRGFFEFVAGELGTDCLLGRVTEKERVRVQLPHFRYNKDWDPKPLFAWMHSWTAPLDIDWEYADNREGMEIHLPGNAIVSENLPVLFEMMSFRLQAKITLGEPLTEVEEAHANEGQVHQPV